MHMWRGLAQMIQPACFIKIDFEIKQSSQEISVPKLEKSLSCEHNENFSRNKLLHFINLCYLCQNCQYQGL